MQVFADTRRDRAEAGFSLIELLVVIVILGVLAAIAVPRLLAQRQDAADAAAVTDLRNLIAVQYGLEAATGAYSADAGVIAAEGWSASPAVEVCVDLIAPDDIAIVAWHRNGRLVYTWQRSVAGIDGDPIPLPTDCTGLGVPVS